MGFFGDMLGGGMELLGGYFSQQSKKSESERAFQREFEANKWMAENSIQMRVRDAQAAGIHPLAALGMNPASGPSYQVGGGGELGASLGRAGQNISRALERNQEIDERIKTEQLRGLTLENDKTANEINARTQLPPPRPGRSVDAVEPPEAAPQPQHSGLRFGRETDSSHDLNYSDQQDAETRYGDSADWIEGLRNRVVDFWKSAGHTARTESAFRQIRKAQSRGDWRYVERMLKWLDGNGPYPGRR